MSYSITREITRRLSPSLPFVLVYKRASVFRSEDLPNGTCSSHTRRVLGQRKKETREHFPFFFSRLRTKNHNEHESKKQVDNTCFPCFCLILTLYIRSDGKSVVTLGIFAEAAPRTKGFFSEITCKLSKLPVYPAVS